MSSATLEMPPAISLRRLVEAAILAPTPDNNQPWLFAVRGKTLAVYLDPARTLPSDVHSMFDLVGIGAAIENAVIAARHVGLKAEVSLAEVERARALPDALPAPYSPPQDKPGGSLAQGSSGTPAQPDPLRPRPVAVLKFLAGARPDPLYPFLATRCTNRKLYSAIPIPQEVLGRIGAAAASFAEVQLHWMTDRPQIGRLAALVAVGDRFRLQYPPFHNEIYRQVRFTAEQAERTRDGLDLRTLALPPGTGLVLRFLRPWSRMQWIHRLRLTALLTLPSMLSVRRSGALGAISVPAPAAAHYVSAGRALERLWLAATAEGLSLQPLGSLPIFLAQWEQLAGRNLSASHQRLALQLSHKLRQSIAGLGGRTLVMLFRTGYAPSPHFRSLRRPPEEVCRDVDL